MSAPLKKITIPELALRIVSCAGMANWSVLGCPEPEVERVASRLRVEIESLGSFAVIRIDQPANAIGLVESVQRADPERPLIVSGLENFSDDDWVHVDLLRSRFKRFQPTILIMSTKTLEGMIRQVPHIAGWIGGSVWLCDLNGEALSPRERESRLQLLRDWSGLSDEEVVRRAEAGTLPKDPEFVEWLVLLNRGDLVGT